MRLFIAIDIPKEVKDYLFELKSGVPNNLAKVNWIAKKNLHITLKFLGEVKEDKLKEIKEKLSNVKFKPFSLKLNKIGFFLRRGTLSIIRIDFTDGNKVIKLQQDIDSELLGTFNGDQKFVPHLSLGRIKNIKNKKEFLNKVNDINLKKEEFLVNEFKLVKSVLTKDGPIYENIEIFKA